MDIIIIILFWCKSLFTPTTNDTSRVLLYYIEAFLPMTFKRLSRLISSEVLPENIFPIIIDKPISLINIILYFLYG